MELKLNGVIYSEGKLNGEIISFLEPTSELKITNTSSSVLSYYFANESGILEEYSKLMSLSQGATFEKFNELNVAPASSTRLVGVNSAGSIVSTIAIPSALKKTLGNKKYSVGVISDIHIDAYRRIRRRLWR